MKQFLFLIPAAIITQISSAQNWLTSGNGGLNNGNFLGTTDKTPVIFKTNNNERMRIITGGDIGIGTANPSQKLHVNGNINMDKGFRLYMEDHPVLKVDSGNVNTFLGNGVANFITSGHANTGTGYRSFYANTTGSYNTANGAFSLYSNTEGYSNTAFGTAALYGNITGYSNTATGSAALNHNTTGSNNSAVGVNALGSNTTGYSNTAVGTNAIFKNGTISNLVAFGDSALYNDGVGATQSYHAARNTAVGSKALYSTTIGYANTATGYQCMYANVTGSYNTSSGLYALYSNTGGFNNTAAGTVSLYSNSTGNNNTAIGNGALYSNTTGHSNVAIGTNALFTNTFLSNLVAVGDSALLNLSSYWCTAVGSKAGMNNTTGSKNTYLGYQAGITVTTGTSNTIIGATADVSSGTLTNATAIGSAAIVNASNKVRIGNGSVTSIGGAVGWTNFSDERIKKDVRQNVPGLKFINLLKPVTYHFDIDKEEDIIANRSDDWDGKYDIAKIQFTGFLAQEVEAAANQIGFDFSGIDAPKNQKDLYGLRYAEFVVPLVKAVQELSKLNDVKDAVIDELKEKDVLLQQEIDELKAMIIEGKSSSISSELSVPASPVGGISGASLQQNIPNPFNHTTTINYALPRQYSSAKIVVTDKTGKILKEVNLSGSGRGSLTLDASILSSGAYNYSLYVDGRLIDAKVMILAK